LNEGQTFVSPEKTIARLSFSSMPLLGAMLVRSAQQWSSGAGLLPTEMVHGRARAPPRQTWRVAVNEGS